jgi:hypothetical protein
MRILVIALALAVAGCGAAGTEINSTRTTCADEPPIPAAPVTDAANGKYLRGLRAAWADCKSKLQWIADYVAK